MWQVELFPRKQAKHCRRPEKCSCYPIAYDGLFCRNNVLPLTKDFERKQSRKSEFIHVRILVYDHGGCNNFVICYYNDESHKSTLNNDKLS